MADHGRHAAPTHGVHQRQRVLHQVEQWKRTHVPVIAAVPTGGLAITALVGCDNVVARLRQRQQDFALTRIFHAFFQSRTKLNFLARIQASQTRSSIAWTPVEIVA